MPPSNEPVQQKVLHKSPREPHPYPDEAIEFVRQGLGYTIDKVHTTKTDPGASRHVTGQQLCHGLCEFALMQWGLMARTVLARWNILSTLDFGKIVFALIDAGQMQKTPDDCLEDFRNVYEFRSAFELRYRIHLQGVS